MFRSLFILAAPRHCVWIPFLLSGSPTLCPDPLSFLRLSSIVSRSPYRFNNFPTLCPNPLSFRRLSDIVPRSLFVLVALWHHVRIPLHFSDSPASCPDPFSFQWLSNIVPESPCFFLWFSDIVSGSLYILAALWHRVQIFFLF